jgi:ABC-type nickel/cobalt efflux system permease component RcnA
VTLVNSAGSIGVALLLGVSAILLARRARERLQITLGRARGRQAARVGRILGILGILVGLTAGLALGFYGLLSLFAG